MVYQNFVTYFSSDLDNCVHKKRNKEEKEREGKTILILTRDKLLNYYFRFDKIRAIIGRTFQLSNILKQEVFFFFWLFWVFRIKDFFIHLIRRE